MEEGGSSSRRVSQEFEKTRNIFERGSPSVSPTENLSFSSIKTISGVGSVRKTRKLSRVYTHASVGPLFPAVLSTSSSVNILKTESESRMGSVSVSSSRIDRQPLLAKTQTNTKRGMGEGGGGSTKKRFRQPWK